MLGFFFSVTHVFTLMCESQSASTLNDSYSLRPSVTFYKMQHINNQNTSIKSWWGQIAYPHWMPDDVILTYSFETFFVHTHFHVEILQVFTRFSFISSGLRRDTIPPSSIHLLVLLLIRGLPLHIRRNILLLLLILQGLLRQSARRSRHASLLLLLPDLLLLQELLLLVIPIVLLLLLLAILLLLGLIVVVLILIPPRWIVSHCFNLILIINLITI